MTNAFKVLVLTDHTGHSDQNSIYAILHKMVDHSNCASIHVASRGLKENLYFFDGMQRDALMGCVVDEQFRYTESGEYFKRSLKKLRVKDFDLVLMRLPRPISDEFLLWIDEVFSHAVIINNPRGIVTTSNKKYLLNFKDVCPDIRVCYSIKEIQEEVEKHPIVLKPLKEYGGRGLLRITENILDDGMKQYDAHQYLSAIEERIEKEGYLSMKFLKNVSQGDKRILVVNGEILAGSLRLPGKDSWLCNVSQGGTSVATQITDEERKIIAKINPALKELGILIYGADTLVDDEGKRVLSEVNTLSIGGFPQAEVQSGKPVIKSLISKIFEYANEQSRRHRGNPKD